MDQMRSNFSQGRFGPRCGGSPKEGGARNLRRPIIQNWRKELA